MNMNKRDLYKYRKFLNLVKNGTDDAFLDRCLPLLVRFIERNYSSDDTKMFDIDDFIQECFVKMEELRDKDVFSLSWKLKQEFQKALNKLNESQDYQFVEPIEMHGVYDEIDVSYIDYDNMFKVVRGRLATEGQRKVLDGIKSDADTKDIAKKLEVTPSRASELKRGVISKIRKSKEFKDLSEDNMSKFFSCYQVFVLKEARQDKFSGELEDKLKKFWKGTLDVRDYYFYCVQLKNILKFFYKLRDKCVEEDSSYLPFVEEDINNVIASIDDNRIRPNQKAEFERIIEENNPNNKKVR